MLLLLLCSLETGKISVNLDLVLRALLLEEEVAAVAEPVDHVEDEEQERHRHQKESEKDVLQTFGICHFRKLKHKRGGGLEKTSNKKDRKVLMLKSPIKEKTSKLFSTQVAQAFTILSNFIS